MLKHGYSGLVFLCTLELIEEYDMILNLDNFGFPIIDFNPVVINNNGERYILEYNLKAVIDTGSYYCFIDKELIERLKLKPTGNKHKFNKLLFGIREDDTYNILINIPFLNKTFSFIALEKIDDYPYPLILGTQFLTNFEFYYNGKDKTINIKTSR